MIQHEDISKVQEKQLSASDDLQEFDSERFVNQQYENIMKFIRAIKANK